MKLVTKISNGLMYGGLLAVLTVPGMAFAAGGTSSTFGNVNVSDLNTTTTDNGVDYFKKVAVNVINVVLAVVAVIAVFYLIVSGFQYVTAGGSADKVKTARQGIINAIIGLVIIMAAFLIVRLAVSFGNTAANLGNG